MVKILTHEIHQKGWGYEEWIYNGEYCGKILVFEKGKKCSWHFHKIKDETFYVQSGSFLIKYSIQDDLALADEVILTQGQALRIPPQLRHQIIALESSKLFEISTHHVESDSYRLVKGD
jgi:mannose-6-phosphate isomerase-like protein (cupin superfamily)